MSYEDMLHLPHPVPKKHKRMDRLDRAAQFAPFAALTGYDAVIAESARLTEAQIELDEGGKALLDEKLQVIREHLAEKPAVILRIFRPDCHKSGGAYETLTGQVKKLDPVARALVLEGGEVIPIHRIYGIECLANFLPE